MTDQDTLRIAFPRIDPLESYDPARIAFAPEYILLQNLYSPLVELDPKGNLMPGVAEKFEWASGEAHFTIRKDLKTIEGQPITAEDAALSLRRVLVLGKSTHGSLSDILCKGKPLASLTDACEGIEVRGPNLLVLKPGTYQPFLFSMLAAIDFAVIPSSAIDRKTLKIISFKNTSGPYHVSGGDWKSGVTLQLNPTHYHASEKIPKRLVLVPAVEEGKSLELFEKGAVDFLTTVDGSSADKIITFSKANKEATLHSTMNLRTILFSFTESGIKRFDAAKRLAIGVALRSALQPYFTSLPGHERTEQIFPAFGDGTLTDDEVRKLVPTVTPATSGAGIRMTVLRLGDVSKIQELSMKALPGIEVKDAYFIANLESSASFTPDIELYGIDSGFLEDIGLISYAMGTGLFGFSAKEAQDWLRHYSNLPDKRDRLPLLRKLHGDTLKNGFAFPIAAAPYVALVRKPWKLNLSSIYADTQLWLVQN